MRVVRDSTQFSQPGTFFSSSFGSRNRMGRHETAECWFHHLEINILSEESSTAAAPELEGKSQRAWRKGSGLLFDSAEKVRFPKTEKIFRSQMAYNERSALG